MICLIIRCTIRRIAFVMLPFWTVSLFGVVSLAGAVVVGDQVELRATYPSGVPFHSTPGGGQTFERVPGGTVATVTDLAREGRWLQLRLANARTGQQ